MATFGDVWRGAQVDHPDVPALLLRKWLQRVYEDLCRRFPFSFLHTETSLSISDARSVTCVVTQGSAAVTSAGLFLAADEGRQFRVGTYPVYTVADFVNANQITLDRVYAAADGAAASGQILDAFYTAPADFARFIAVAHPDTLRPIPFWTSIEELNRVDPLRRVTGLSARVLVPIGVTPAVVTTLAGRFRFEWWPTPTAEKQYPALYAKRTSTLIDTDEFLGVFAAATDTLELGLAVRSARWPGTKEHPNPMFNLGLARMLQDDYDKAAGQTWLRDNDFYSQRYSTDKWHRISAWSLAYDTTQLRATDATSWDYASGVDG